MLLGIARSQSLKNPMHVFSNTENIYFLLLSIGS